MHIEDGKKRGKGKMPGSPILSPKGNIKGIGPLGIYTGGPDPLVVKPTPGIRPGRMAAVMLRGDAGGRSGK